MRRPGSWIAAATAAVALGIALVAASSSAMATEAASPPTTAELAPSSPTTATTGVPASSVVVDPDAYVPDTPITEPPAPRLAAPSVPTIPAAASAAPTDPVALPAPPAEVEGKVQLPELADEPTVEVAPPETPPNDLSIVSTGIPHTIDWTPSFVATNVGFGALLLLLLLVASQLFNDAMKMHHDRIVNHLATRSALVAGLAGAFGKLPRIHPVISFVVAAVTLGLLADPNVSLSTNTIGQILGMGLALGLIVLVYDGTASLVISHATGQKRSYRVFPIAIAVAIGCLLMSRIFDVAPGVLYGLFVGAVFAGTLDPRIEGRAYARGSLVLVACAMVAWGIHRTIEPTAAEPTASMLAVMFDTTAAVLFVGGLQSVIVQLLPMPFLWGESVIRWSRAGWAVLLVASLAIYMQFVVRPNPNATTWSNLWFILVFVAGALAFWGYCVYRRWNEGHRPPPEPDETATAEATAI